MSKRILMLGIILLSVLFLTACAPPVNNYAGTLSRQNQPYDIHIKVMEKAGKMEMLDQHVGENNASLRYNLAYSNYYYDELFKSLNILERDFYCFPGLESFALNTILDPNYYLYSKGYSGDRQILSSLLNAPTLHGDRLTTKEFVIYGSGKLKFGSMFVNAPLDDKLNDIIDENGFIIERPDYYEFYDFLVSLVEDSTLKPVDFVDLYEYEYGIIMSFDGILWPTGVDFPESGPQCSVAKIVEHEDDYSLFQSVILNASLLDTLNGEEAYTVFASNNDALLNIFNSKTPKFTRQQAVNNNENFLKFHTVEGRYTFSDLLNQSPFELTTLNGERLTVVSDGTDVFINGNKISEKDMVGTNGYVHGIDGSLYKELPENPVSIFDIVAEKENLSTLQSILNLLAQNDIFLEDDTYTLFAPTNTGFDAWLLNQDIDLYDNPNLDVLLDVLLSHLTSGSYTKAQLLTMTSNAPFEFESLLADAVITVSQDDEGNLYANGVFIETTDLLADDGVIHKVSAPIILEDPISIFETIALTEDFSRFNDLLDVLAQQGVFIIPDIYTVFVPLNDGLLDWLANENIDMYSVSQLETLTDFVFAHFVIGSYTRNQLFALTMTEPVELQTLLANVFVTVSQDDEGKLYVNDVLLEGEHIIGSDGVIHAVSVPIAPEKTNTLYDILTSVENFSIFLQLLEDKGLDVLLTDQQTNRTVIAPSNQAFTDLMDIMQIDLDTLKNLENLEDILTYHFMPGIVSKSTLTQLVNANTFSINTFLQDRALTISLDNQNLVEINGVPLHFLEGPADNGYLLFIETILVPEPYEVDPGQGNLLEVLAEGGVFDIFLQALEATGLDTLLSEGTSYTIFAPLDGLFTVLMMEKEITLEQFLADENLSELLKAHIVLGTWTADDLKALLANGQNQILTLNNNVLTITQEGDFLYINGKSIVVPNSMALNGVMHSLAGLLVDEA